MKTKSVLVEPDLLDTLRSQVPDTIESASSGGKVDGIREHQAIVMSTLGLIPPLRGIPKQTTEVLNMAWAPSTKDQRKSLWHRLTIFRKTRPFESLDRSAAIFVSTMGNGVSIASKKTYLSSLSAMLGHLQVPAPTTKLMVKGYANLGANIPTDPATPATWDEVRVLMRQIPSLAMQIWLMWKTASRWDDLSHLVKESFLVVSESEIIIRFGKTKANPTMACKPTSLVHLLDKDPMVWQTDFLRSLKPGEKLMKISREAFVSQIERVYPHLSAHSFKKGANDALVREIELGNLEVRVLPLILKHSDKLHGFPENTLRYSSEPARFARILGTGRATRLL